MSSIQEEVEARLATAEPAVEVLLAEVSRGTVRLFIDHADGVTLDLCERVTHALGDVRERYALEVSSPGIERPLTKPAHYRRFLGRRVRVRVRAARDAGHRAEGERVRTFTGELVGASDREVTLAADSGLIAVPYADIHRSNLVEE
jgi:ribosome maturation factor RimP